MFKKNYHIYAVIGITRNVTPSLEDCLQIRFMITFEACFLLKLSNKTLNSLQWTRVHWRQCKIGCQLSETWFYLTYSVYHIYIWYKIIFLSLMNCMQNLDNFFLFTHKQMPTITTMPKNLLLHMTLYSILSIWVWCSDLPHFMPSAHRGRSVWSKSVGKDVFF